MYRITFKYALRSGSDFGSTDSCPIKLYMNDVEVGDGKSVGTDSIVGLYYPYQEVWYSEELEAATFRLELACSAAAGDVLLSVDLFNMESFVPPTNPGGGNPPIPNDVIFNPSFENEDSFPWIFDGSAVNKEIHDQAYEGNNFVYVLPRFHTQDSFHHLSCQLTSIITITPSFLISLTGKCKEKLQRHRDTETQC